MTLKFEWDINKANSNQTKHGVSFEEARSVLSDFFSITVSDPLHPENEERWVTIGQSEYWLWFTQNEAIPFALFPHGWQIFTKEKGMKNHEHSK